MAKPATIPTWATSGSIVVPAGAKITSGWVTGERPPAQIMNWKDNLVGQWLTYLDQFFNGAGSATDNIHTSGTANLDGLVTVGAGLTSAVNTNITLSGTGVVKHGTYTTIRSAFGEAVSTGSVGPSGQIWRLAVSGILEIRLPELPIGSRIINVRVRLKDGTTTGVVTVRVQTDVDGTRVSLATQASAASGAIQNVTLSAINAVIAAGTSYFAQCAGGTTTSDYYRVEVDWDQP